MKVRLCLKYFKNEIKLPTKEKMFEDFHNEKERRKEMGMDIRKAHLLGGTDQVILLNFNFVTISQSILKKITDFSEITSKF